MFIVFKKIGRETLICMFKMKIRITDVALATLMLLDAKSNFKDTVSVHDGAICLNQCGMSQSTHVGYK